jgi:N-acetylneuraminate synthase/N,N'-diacetyllegionaminate synthase
VKNSWVKDRVFVIAEAGVNHAGDVRLAKRLVDAAKNAGCDAVKFQIFNAEQLVSESVPLAEYQKRNGAGSPKGQIDLLRELELSHEEFRSIKRYCDRKKVIFLATPFDFESADFLEQVRVPMFKVPSGEVTNLPFIRFVAQKGKPVILSTGMSNLDEVAEAVEAIESTGNKRLILLHCVTQYPAPVEEVNLKAMVTLRSRFGVPVGYSDHTLGFEISVAAVALGAVVIEKHLTLNRRMKGPDHKASLEPNEFKEMVRCIRNVEKGMGDGIKRAAHCEKRMMRLVRRSIVAGTRITKGQRITEGNIAIKRPGYGIQPKDWEKIIGRTARSEIKKDSVLSWAKMA